MNTKTKTSIGFRTLMALVLGILIFGTSLPAHAEDPVVEEIPWEGPTVLPNYVGTPAKPHSAANSGVPQNPLLAPNPFNTIHTDPWMSDTANTAGPLGINPVVLSSTLEAARHPNPDDLEPWIFNCIATYFDSHGRVIAVCVNPYEATVVLVDPDTLEVLHHYPLEIREGSPYIGTGKQQFLTSLGSVYSFLDVRDQFTIVSGGHKIITLVEGGSEDNPVLELLPGNKYDLVDVDILPENAIISGVMLDWQGRIWFTTPEPATIWVINPATYPDVKKVILDEDELIRNTFAVTKTGVDSSAAYVVSSEKMYRIDAGSDDQPEVVWSEGYKTDGKVKDGQYELGSGTSPTILGEGKYVAITDNWSPMNVVVFRTDERLDPNEDRIVCEESVFEETPGALSNSLVGSRLSLIATNNYGYLFDWKTGKLETPSAPGFERIDINPNGKGCKKVWTNNEVATTTSAKLSTKTGLIYTVSREFDELNKLYEYYWIALDFRTGETVWKKMAGTGQGYDSFYPALMIGPNGALYYGGYGGFMTVRDVP